uniref:Uncharacterized protein n=1 Tax=Nelumbo nucifera TaxID=4432 RepID=A0A822ZWR0_NELNU|nr:TPA_asm: hypothetical protein HUJ06_017616 [Nelumbo nucifera]
MQLEDQLSMCGIPTKSGAVQVADTGTTVGPSKPRTATCFAI